MIEPLSRDLVISEPITRQPEARNPFARLFTVGELPERIDLVLYQGDCFTMVLIVFDADGLPADLSGAVAKSQIRLTPPHPDVLASFVCAVTANEVELYLSHPESTGLPVRAVWDCQITLPDGCVQTLCFGNVTVQPEVTR
jgi:hypothetical protein